MRRGLRRPISHLVFACSVVGAGVIGYFSGLHIGAPTYEIASVAGFSGQTAEIYDGNFQVDKHVGVASITALLPALRAATWTNQKFMRKGAWGLQLNDGTKIWISHYGEFFWLSGVPGYYVIQTPHRFAFNEYTSKHLNDRVIDWRRKQNLSNE